ncbi:phosphofructokinase-domain-containing protein [Paraphysoderma sedebokerense]|nr:phosphofructokinase-domain-containing protein [Paraphysoderma sedebokerense]
MNAAVRAIVRMAYVKGMEPFAVYDGYQGLVDNRMKKMNWDDVRGLLSLGGTSIGTARCAAFRQRDGRRQAVFNMVKNGIDALVVIGGDGSLTGADTFRREWPSLLEELVKDGKITVEEQQTYSHLNIVGLVGSIDNDMSSTDLTIGCITALHRTCESVDALESTALSHGRAFVVEVMGRHCGWLALMAAIASGADWLFVPERPMMMDDWETSMVNELKKLKDLGQRRLMIIVCEGALDRDLNPIKPDHVRDVIQTRLGYDTRVTTLGHVQRGGVPCFFDRYLGTVQGCKAVEEILKATPDTPSPMIGISNNQITSKPLMKAVELTHAVGKAIDKKDFATAMELRDPEFGPAYDNFMSITIPQTINPGKRISGLRIGIMHIGAPAGGMNAATRVATLYALNKGHTPLAIYNGFVGLVNGDVRPISWMDVNEWTKKGGSELGTNRGQPNDLGLVAYQLQKHNIQALLLIGGFEAYTALNTLYQHREKYPAFCVPMVHLPATISNNVPGTDYSLGSDTALNMIVDACDKIKLSASASRKRVFVVEVHGGNVGYLATMGGLAGGATSTYIPEEGITLDLLKKDIDLLIRRYKEEGTHHEGRVILRNEAVSSTYTTEVVSDILKAEGKGLFDSRTAILGHLQQGGVPSPLDRIRSTRLAILSLNWIEQHALRETDLPVTPLTSANDTEFSYHPKSSIPSVYTLSKDSACVIGIRGAKVVFTPVVDLLMETDMERRKSTHDWWMEYRPLVKVLAKYTVESDGSGGERLQKL